MARLGIAYDKDDIIELIPRVNPLFAGLTFGKHQTPEGEIGFYYPFHPKIAQVFYRNNTFEADFVDDFDINRTSLLRYSEADRTYNQPVDRRSDIDPADDFLEFIERQNPLLPEFGYAFFDKIALENVLSLANQHVILSVSRIQPGRGIREYNAGTRALGDEIGTHYFTFKLEPDTFAPAAADIGVPEFTFGLPCPPYWVR